MSELMKTLGLLHDPDRGFRTWHLPEIYNGPGSTGKVVPNVDDSILIWGVGYHRVIDVDPTSYISEWIYVPFTEQNDMDNEDILLGVGPGYASETFRAFLDTSVKPYRLAVDSRLHSYGDGTTHYKIFLGTDITTDAARVISAKYDQSMNYVGENIPFSLVANNNLSNLSVKAPDEGHCNIEMDDGQPVTLVQYSSTGAQIGINKLLVVNTSFMRKSEASQLVIDAISLTSPWLAEDSERTLRIPMNLPIEALSLRGKVHYSNGHVRDVPIDGTKMDLYGLENYISTINGQKAPLVLTYKLSPNEATNIATAKTHISVPYSAISTEVAGTYSVKLFCVPEWIDEFAGWRLEWYLYNLDRGDVYYATPYVEMGINSGTYNPLLFGTKQNLIVAVDMQRVDPRLAAYRHAQTFAITLVDNGIADRTPYFLEYSPGQDPLFGGDYSCRVSYEAVGSYKINLANGFDSVTDWLDALYYPVEPLFDRSTESGPLMPTHFILAINGFRTKYPLADWNKVLDSVTGGKPGRSAVLEWVREVSGSTLALACSPLKIFHEVNDGGGSGPTLNLYPSWATAVGDTTHLWFGSNSAATLSLKRDGIGLADWTATYDWDTGDELTPPITFVFADGGLLPTSNFDVKVEIDSRYENGSNKLYPDCITNQWVAMGEEFPIPIKLAGFIGSNKHLTLRIYVRDSANHDNEVSGLMTIRTDPNTPE